MASSAFNVVIYGGSAYTPDSEVWRAAAALGEAIARRGWTLVNGGYGGTMLASAQAARAAGGRVTGVACTIFNAAPNPHLTETVWTDNIHDRLRRLIELGDAYICLPGSTGTLAELAMTWEMMNKRQLERRPLLCWGDFWRPVVGIFSHESVQDARISALNGLAEQRGALIEFVVDAEAAVAAIARTANATPASSKNND